VGATKHGNGVVAEQIGDGFEVAVIDRHGVSSQSRGDQVGIRRRCQLG